MRIILKRLACSFARQEAKLDRILSFLESTRPQTQPQFSTPNPVPSQSQSNSLEYTPAVMQWTPLPDLDSRLLEEHDLTGASDSVPVGGSNTIRLSRSDYAYAKGTTKPTAMALRLLDKLFTTPTLMLSTVNGTKDFAALDSSKIAEIKAEVMGAFSYQCRSSE